MDAAGRYAAGGNQTKENLIHLNKGEIVGEWRDSTYGKPGFFVTSSSAFKFRKVEHKNPFSYP